MAAFEFLMISTVHIYVFQSYGTFFSFVQYMYCKQHLVSLPSFLSL